MEDILDEIMDEVDDEGVVTFSAEEISESDFSGEILEAELVDDNQMSEEEAKAITDSIKSTVNATFVLLERAHSGKAYKALGYETFKEYIESEFNFTTQRAYQILDLGKVIKAIEQVVPEGTVVTLTEAQARDIKRELPKITSKIEESVASASPEEASSIVEDVVKESRNEIKSEKEKAKKDNIETSDEDLEEEQEQLEEEANKILEEDSEPQDETEVRSDPHEYVNEDSDEEDSEKAVQARYFYSFKNLSQMKDALPDPEDMVDMIADNQSKLVEDGIRPLYDWIDDFLNKWDDEH